MGSKCAPSAACLYVADFEERYSYPYATQPLLWKCYIDDIFIIWTHGDTALDAFVSYLNNCHPSIKFAVTKSTLHVDFLDLTVKKTKDGICIELFIKPTSSLAYLHKTSCHPSHVFTSLPYGEFLRVRRNCSEENTFNQYADCLKQAFCTRGYDPQEIQTALDKAQAQDRTQLLSKGIPTDNSPLVSDEDTSDEVEPATVTRPSFLVLTHHLENQVFHTILNNHWDLLGASDTIRCLCDACFKIGSWRNRLLQDILVHSSIPLPHKCGRQGKRINECPKTSCIYCDSMDETGHIYSYRTKQSYESKFNIYCQSSNLVYCLQCNTCSNQYVGQSKRKLLERLREHFNNIKKTHPNDPIGCHFNATWHSGDIKQVTTYILAFVTLSGDINGAL